MTPRHCRHPAALPILALLSILTLSACSTFAVGGGDPGSGPSDPTTGTEPGAGSEDPTRPDDIVSGTPGPAEPPAGDGALRVEPQRGVRDAIPHAIDRISVAADGRTVTVYWWGGVEDCYALDEVRTERDGDGRLVITVLEGTRRDLPPDTACIEIALLRATTITLDERVFVDGSQER